jgi:hypothetical protein
MAAKSLEITGALDPLGATLMEDSLYRDPRSSRMALQLVVGASLAELYREHDATVLETERNNTRREEVYERAMTRDELIAKYTSRQSNQQANLVNQTQQQHLRTEQALPQNQGMVVHNVKLEQEHHNLLSNNNDQVVVKASSSRSRAGSAVTPGRADQLESKAVSTAKTSNSRSSRRSSSSSSRSQRFEHGFAAGILAERSYREPGAGTSLEDFISGLVKQREPKGDAVDRILSRREDSVKDNGLMAMQS